MSQANKVKYSLVCQASRFILISLQPDVEDSRYDKLLILLGQIVYVGNIKGLHYQVAKI